MRQHAAVFLIPAALEFFFAGAALAKSADALRVDAVAQARQGKYAQARLLMDQALVDSGNASEVGYDYAVILAWAEDHEKAIKVFEEFAAKTPVPDYVLPEIARSYRAIKNYDKAIELYTKYLTRQPGEKKGVKGLVYAYLDAGKTQEAETFLAKVLESSGGKGDTALFTGDILYKKGDVIGALKMYGTALEKDPGDLHAQLGMSRVLIGQGLIFQAQKMISAILKKEPCHFDALMAKGEILDQTKEHWSAYRHYEEVSSVYPQSFLVRELEYRSLMSLGCTNLVKEMSVASKEKLSSGLRFDLEGDEAMERIRWNEPRIALDLIGSVYQYDEKTPHFVILRRAADEIAALWALDDMKKVVHRYETLKKKGENIPPWTQNQAAGAYLYLRQPKTALVLYQETLKSGWDPEGATRLAIADTLIESGRYREADRLLAQVDQETPVQVTTRGVMQDNWVKEDIAVKHAWSLLHQDRLAEAQKELLTFLSKAPGDTHVRSALAQTYLWRGWPRLALEEFDISRNLDEKDVNTNIGRCYALNENDRGEEARRQARELLQAYPTNRHVQQLNRYFEVQDKRTLAVNAEFSQEHPGTQGFIWSTRFDQPVKPWRSIYSEYAWHRNGFGPGAIFLRQTRIGADWRLSRDWRADGGVFYEDSGDHVGHFEGIAWTPDDRWFINAAYDSRSLDVPLRIDTPGISSKDTSLVLRYRASESFTGEIVSSFRQFSDGNNQVSYGLRLDRALTTGPVWKTRLMLEGSRETNSKIDGGYFSPESIASAYLVPMVEHVWFRHYERALVDRLYLGLGEQWEKGVGGKSAGYVRYEQDCHLSDVLSLLIGVIYAKMNYDGEATSSWTNYLTLRYRF